MPSPRQFSSNPVLALRRILTSIPALVVACTFAMTEAAPDDKSKYSSYHEAWSIGAALYNARKFDEATVPLEAALKMAPDDRSKLKAHEALIPCYRLLPTPEKMMASVEYVIGKSTRKSGLSRHRRGYISYLHQRGKVKEAVKRYEDRLKKTPDDFVSLYLLSEIYTTVERNPKRAAEVLKELNRIAPVDQNDPAAMLKQSQMARQYIRAKDYKNGVDLYLKLATMDKEHVGAHLKEAAMGQLKMGDTEKTVATARAAVKAGPDKRSELVTYFWNRLLGDLLLQHGTPEEAIPLLEEALTLTKIEGYRKTTQAKLDEARRKAGK